MNGTLKSRGSRYLVRWRGGDAVPGSDADLLVVVSHSTESFLDRAVRYRPVDVGVGVDVVAYTHEELAALLEAGNAFVRQALREGMVLYP